MKEFAEKLIERLEEFIETAKSEGDYTYIKPFEIVKDAVKDLAEEHNNGWIPCSERLPSKEEYQKCNGQFIVSDGNRTYATYFDIYDTLKFGEPTITKFVIDRCVIAWQPLPAPYKKGE